MKKASLALFVSLLALSGAGYAQSQAPSPTSEIRESTDPARYDEVMRRAQELQAQQQSSGASMTSGESETPRKATKRSKKSGMKSGKGTSGASGSDASSGSGGSSDSSSGQGTSK